MALSIYDEIVALREALHYHNRKYYVENTPEISDFEFDHMMQHLILRFLWVKHLRY